MYVCLSVCLCVYPSILHSAYLHLSQSIFFTLYIYLSLYIEREVDRHRKGYRLREMVVGRVPNKWIDRQTELKIDGYVEKEMEWLDKKRIDI
jgi:hypothetical protein